MKLSLRTITALLIITIVIGDCVVFGGEITNNAAAINNDDIINLAEGENININGCDESKCVSTGLSIQLFNWSFTCYARSTFYEPMMCADGYKPRIVKNEYVRDSDRIFDSYYQYFTCCPPNNLSSDDVIDVINSGRHCSNSTSINNWYDSNIKTIVCDDPTKPYPRPMKKTYTGIESYVCCDSFMNGNYDNQTTNNNLDEIECVPYNNEFYQRYYVEVDNDYGHLQSVFCDEPESGYRFARYVDNKASGFLLFECCKTGPGLPPFIQDYFFKITVYPQIAISAIAVISSMVIIIALLIPLLIPLLRNLRTQSTNIAGTSENRSTNAITRSQGTATEPVYSSYNLYLVYLAIPDLILNLYLVIIYGSYANQKFNPNFYGNIVSQEIGFSNNGTTFEAALIVACSTANMYLICVVLHEILILLRNIHQVIQCDPPSVLKVTLQATAVYLFSIFVFTIRYVVWGHYYARNLYRSIMVVAYIFPICFFVYVWITIICRGYMSSVTGRMKELVWYFFRIVFVFCVIWLPGMCLYVLGAAKRNGVFLVIGAPIYYNRIGHFVQIGLLFCSIQPIVSTCMAMTKSDVRKYTTDLITLSYIRKQKRHMH